MNPLSAAVTVSLSTSVTATAVCAAVGIPLGGLLAVKSFRGKALVIGTLESLLAVPTVVVGLAVYSLLRQGSFLGPLHLLFTVRAIVIGQVVLALPTMVYFTFLACTAVEQGALETARTLGARGFRLVSTLLGEARIGILAAVTATFGRLIGEVGVSMMLGGNIAGQTRTITTTIALETAKGDFALAARLGWILLAVAFVANGLVRVLRRAGARWSVA
jgi:tungstate transport system permease protein